MKAHIYRGDYILTIETVDELERLSESKLECELMHLRKGQLVPFGSRNPDSFNEVWTRKTARLSVGEEFSWGYDKNAVFDKVGKVKFVLDQDQYLTLKEEGSVTIPYGHNKEKLEIKIKN